MGDDRRIIDNHNYGDTDFLMLRGGSPSPSRSLPPPSNAVSVGVNGGVKYILHTVTKFDTLAGVAIKYGVEVADIKRLNGLVTDLQMFARKTLRIPLPGRHPPSPSLCNAHDTPKQASTSQQTPSVRRHSDLFDSFQSLKLTSSSNQQVSPAMSSLQGYYGLSQSDQKPAKTEGFEMSVYRKGGSHYLEDGPFSTSSPPIPNRPLSHQRKSKSVANVLMSENNGLYNPLLSQEEPDSSKWIDKLLRRRQKSETDFTARTPEKLLKEENSSGSAISAITGKGLALRPKSANRTVSGGVEGESSIPINLGDSLVTDSNDNGVRKSSSTSSLHESSDNNSNGGLLISSLWPSLKTDFQALSTAAMTRPIFDSLPKPIARRNKKALD